MISKQLALWIAVAGVGFAISVTVLEALGAPTIWVFLAGIVFNELSDPVMEWLQSWESAEERAANSGNSDHAESTDINGEHITDNE